MQFIQKIYPVETMHTMQQSSSICQNMQYNMLNMDQNMQQIRSICKKICKNMLNMQKYAKNMHSKQKYRQNTLKKYAQQKYEKNAKDSVCKI